MAKSVDEVVLKVGVEGQASLDQLNTRLGNIESSSKQTAQAMNQVQGGVRNTAYQIQDLAVQLSMGTNAFMALGQQLPQLLSAFGTTGVVIGAVAAVAIPVLQKALEAAGYDFRNLNQRVTELTTSTKEFIAAQQANQPTLAGLTATFGTLTQAAKDFYNVQEQILKQKTYAEVAASLAELKKNLDFMNADVSKGASLGKLLFGDDFKEGSMIFEARMKVQSFLLGISTEQAKELARRLKDIDGATPEQTIETLTGIVEYLKQGGADTENFRKQFEKIIEPVLKINNALIDSQKNIRASAEEASALNAALLGIQNRFQPDINAARRNFDQIRAIRLEGEQRIAEFRRQIEERTAKDGVDRSKEFAAFRLRTEQDVSDKIKDFQKGQVEAFRSASLINDAKTRQIGLESDILRLQEEGKLSALNAFQFNEDLLRNAFNYNEALKNIDEQRRKNNITIDQQKKLEAEAAAIRERADELAYQAMMKRQQDFIMTQEQIVAQDGRRLALFNQTATLTDRERRNAEAIFNIEEERQKQLRGLQSIQDPILRVTKEKEILDIYDQRIAAVKRQQDAERDLSRNFDAGWQRAYNNYIENSKNAFETARSLFEKAMKGMEDLIVNFVKTGKFQWKDFVNSMLEELLRSQIRTLMAQMLSFGNAGVSKTGSFFGSLLGFANGGMIPTNEPVLVGERGPEIISGAAGRVVTPNEGLGNSYVTYNISAVDARSFKEMIAQDPSFIHAVAVQGSRTVPGRR